MGLKVVIFEDDKDVADIIKDMMEKNHFEVVNCYNISKKDWHDADVVLGDFRNKIVDFNLLKKECYSRDIPLIAISGYETDFRPQLLKPFHIEEVQSMIMNELMRLNHLKSKKDKLAESNGPLGFLKKLFAA
jgi:DNA-binding response OmpR family regulator